MGNWPLPQIVSTVIGAMLLGLYVARADALFFAGFVLFGLVGLGPTALHSVRLSRQELALTFRQQSQMVAAAIETKAEEVAPSSEDLTVTPEYVKVLRDLAEALRRSPPSSPEDFANLATASLTSAGNIRPGGQGTGWWSMTLTFNRPLARGTTTVLINLDTPGISITGTPILSASVPASAHIAPDGRSIVMTVPGPTMGPTSVTISGLALHAGHDAIPGTVQARFSINGSPSRVTASLGTIVPASDTGAR